MLATASRKAVDTRTPIAMWQLLIWAYKRQMVHYEPHSAIGPQGYAQTSSFAMLAELGVLKRGGSSDRWSINAAGTTAHADAHLVHDRVMLLAPADRDLIIHSATAGSPPEWSPYLPPLRVVPVRRGGTGRIQMLYRNSNKPVACQIDYEGIPEDEASAIRAAARKSYAQWWRLLRRLRLSLYLNADWLARWRITDTGAIREPWALSAEHR